MTFQQRIKSKKINNSIRKSDIDVNREHLNLLGGSEQKSSTSIILCVFIIGKEISSSCFNLLSNSSFFAN
jgi:hypothetical protein